MATFHGDHKSQLSREPNHFFNLFFTPNYSSLTTIRVPFVGDKSWQYLNQNSNIFSIGVVFFCAFLPNFRFKSIVAAIMLQLKHNGMQQVSMDSN